VDLTTARLIAINNQPLRRRVTMKRHLLVTLAAVLALGFTASMARAQCTSIRHPSQAKKFQVSLVQAFVSCGNPGGSSINAMTEGGIPSCQPVLTFNQANGGEPTGWRFDETPGVSSKGTIKIDPRVQPACLQKDTPVPPGCPGGLNPIGDTVDLRVKMSLKGVIATASPTGRTGTGTLHTLARATLDDRMFGDMTVIDFGADFPFSLTSGKSNLQTSADALLNTLPAAGLPHCTSIEVVNISVLDENGNAFASLGSWMP
jgi:hypothetical protein